MQQLTFSRLFFHLEAFNIRYHNSRKQQKTTTTTTARARTRRRTKGREERKLKKNKNNNNNQPSDNKNTYILKSFEARHTGPFLLSPSCDSQSRWLAHNAWPPGHGTNPSDTIYRCPCSTSKTRKASYISSLDYISIISIHIHYLQVLWI